MTGSFDERLRAACVRWAEQGYGAPLAVYAFYAAKIGLYVGGWLWFCQRDPAFSLARDWASDRALLVAALWTLLFEGLGLGCGSGPLTARFVPPFGGALYFLRPGTTKIPLFRALGHARGAIDVLGYAAVIALLGRALIVPDLSPAVVPAIALGIVGLGVLDRTLFLVFRPEHHLSVLICWWLAPDQWLAGAKAVWLAIWLWAAISKLTPHFPSVVGVMGSNAPILPLAAKRALYRSFPDDLRPSGRAVALAHLGTVLEVAFPVALWVSGGGWPTAVALGVTAVFHAFILFQVPAGVPLEWNVIMVYGAVVLFGVHADLGLSSIGSPALIAWLVGFHVALPLYGSLVPSRVSFLLSMRYYAGNWAASVWLFQPGASDKLHGRLTKWARSPREQLAMLYPPEEIDQLEWSPIAFRNMHLHGRALRQLARRAVDDLDRTEWLDGELVAGMALGWNFGEGHLHDHRLLAAIQAQCGFAPGELRVVTLESLPLGGSAQAWAIHDAATGLVERGEVRVADLLERPVP